MPPSPPTVQIPARLRIAACTALLATAALLGTTPVGAAEKASEQVSPFHGSFSTQIAIEVPPFRGLEPRLALAYSSEGRNGFVGVGWSLSGFSTIERVNSGRGTPRFDATDIYLLDGQELVPCQPGSVSPSCTTGGTHSTEIESYLKISFDSVANTWEVWGRDGTRTVFSPTFVVTGGGTLRWGQASTVDSNGNTVAYNWACTVGPSVIPTTTLLPAAEVEHDTLSWHGDVPSLRGNDDNAWYMWRVENGTFLAKRISYTLDDLPPDAISVDSVVAGYRINTQTTEVDATTSQPPGISQGIRDGGVGGPESLIQGRSSNGWATFEVPVVGPAGGGAWTPQKVNDAQMYHDGDRPLNGDGRKDLRLTYAYLRVTYQSSAAPSAVQDCYPDSVAYNGFSAVFNRESRPDAVTFAAGVNTIGTTRYRLKSVLVKLASGTPVRAYRLTYSTSPTTARSLLTSVRQYGKDVIIDAAGAITGGTALPAQTFTYTNDTAAKSFQWLYPATSWCSASFLTGDVNGDGRTDQICYSSGQTQVALATSTGFSAPTTWLSATLSRPFVADFNSDGKADLADYISGNGEFKVALSTGSSFPTPASWGIATSGGSTCSAAGSSQTTVQTGDFNGDGTTDVSCRHQPSGNIFVGLSNGTAFTFSIFGQWACDAAGASERAGVVDFDGDGKDDWYCIGGQNANLYVLGSTGSSFTAPASSYLTGSFCDAPNYVLGDLNGDGRTDAACMGNGNVALSTGKSFLSWGSYSAWCANQQAFAADVDGDGASELVCNYAGAPASDIEIRKWTGNGLGAPATWLSTWCAAGVQAGDWNGDSKTDLACDAAGPAVVIAGTGGTVSDLIGKAWNGLKGNTTVGYTPSSAFANTNNPPPKYVVTSLITKSDEPSWTATTTYSYSGGLMDRQERRFLGFRYSRTTLPCITGETNCPYVETWLNQGLASAGKPERIDRFDGSARPLRSEMFTYTTNGTTVPRTCLLTTQTSYVYDGCTAFPCASFKRTEAPISTTPTAIGFRPPYLAMWTLRETRSPRHGTSAPTPRPTSWIVWRGARSPSPAARS